jgi:hypothetical protein
MKFTYYTIIGKDLNLFKGHVENVKTYAGFDRLSCEKEFLVIVYTNSNITIDTTESILNYCEDNNIRTVVYREPATNFLNNLYTCWNLGYENSSDGLVFRGGSDQIFSKDSFISLYDEAVKLEGKKVVLQANTIENSVKLNKIGAISRHFVEDFGGTFDTFDYQAFESFCLRINDNVTEQLIDINTALLLWNKPTNIKTSLGIIDRVDGCSWLMTKEEWQIYGPLPPIENGVTGDVIIHDRMQQAGYVEYIVRDCITYHFVQGER